MLNLEFTKVYSDLKILLGIGDRKVIFFTGPFWIYISMNIVVNYITIIIIKYKNDVTHYFRFGSIFRCIYSLIVLDC